MRKNGAFGMKKKNRKRKIYLVDIINLLMCFENFCWSGHGVQIERYHSLENISWVCNTVNLLD